MRWHWMGVLAVVTGLAVAQEPKSGDQPIRVECHGQLRDGMVAVGGESTGTIVKLPGFTWELQFRDRDGKAFAQRCHKRPVSITGSLRRVTGVERLARWIVDVEKYTERDPAQTADGASIALVGLLARDPRNANQWLIRQGDLACPVKLPADAMAPADQRVSVRGSVEAVQPANATEPFVIRATKLEIANRAERE